MRFLADMGISPRSVEFLARQGHDALHLHAQKLDRLRDPAILAKARDERRVLLTHDLDFGELVAASGASLPSVIVFRLRSMHPENVNRHLEDVIRDHGEALDRGAIISVTERQARVRILPIAPDPDP